VLNPRTGYPSFTENFGPSDKFKLVFSQMGMDSVLVDYFSPDRSLPRPLFSSTPEIPLKALPDTSYYLPYNDTMVYSLPMPGIYKFRFNPEVAEGLSLFNFGENFPQVRTPDDLLAPLVYLTSSAEFRDLRLEANRKLAVDNFWLGTTPEPEAAKELIKVYYNRVLYANLYFSSYKEGWKTDRGMMYIIFGPPSQLEKSYSSEKWIYFGRRNSTPIEFVFNRKENLHTYKDFQLLRSTSSISLWTEAVQSWRNGRIYSPEY
jgi:GWxTD domain-containing protein